MQTTSTVFEQELRKRISQELERLMENIAIGSAVHDYAEYRHLTGQIFAYNRVIADYFDDANTELEKR